jgi:hypothetical protein
VLRFNSLLGRLSLIIIPNPMVDILNASLSLDVINSLADVARSRQTKNVNKEENIHVAESKGLSSVR